MKKTAIIILGLLLTMTSGVDAQWNDNGGSLTTSDKIGIGTASPRAPLEVYGALWAGTTEGGAGISDPRFSGASGLFIGNAGSILDDNNMGLNFVSRSSLRFFVYERTGNAIEAMYIKEENGYVGIGTTFPRAPLEVYGALWVGTTKGGAGISDPRFSGASGLFVGDAGAILDNNNQGLNFISKTNLRFFVDEGSENSIEAMYIKENGFVGIGTNNPSRKLTVGGTVKAKEVIVAEDTGADFVFDDDYTMLSLTELEHFIQKEHHLPGIPSAEQMKRDGVMVGNLQMKLLQKIEEMTLYIIELKKREEERVQKIKKLEDKLEKILSRN